MHIRVTKNPISQNEMHDLSNQPSNNKGDGKNGLEIYFENENNKNEFLEWEHNEDHKISLIGEESAEYVAEG